MNLNEIKELLFSIIESHSSEQFEELIYQQHAVDVALAMDEMDDDEILSLLKLLNPNTIALIIEESEESLQTRIIEMLDTSILIKTFSYMSPDDITDIMGLLTIDHRKDLLGRMRQKDSTEIQMLLGFEPDTAGGIMTTQYIALKSNLSTKEALQKIKDIGPKTEVIEKIFVTNHNNELIGFADLRDILSSSDDITLSEIMDENILFVYPDADQEEVSLIVSKYDLKVLPVVNKRNIILGIITPDDVIDVIVEEHTEDILMLSGVNKDEQVGSKVSVSVTRRLPWLFINLATAFLASFTVGLFEDVIVQVVALAAAMPIVAGMGGNAGTQTLSIVIRGIALGEIDIREDWKYVFNEISLGFINGATTGLITGLILYIKYNNLFLGLIIFAAMIGNLIIAGFFGFMIPLILKKFNLDPAVSSSIFLTTATDVGGFFIFLGLAKMFLPYLL
ncbi:MAG: magnesium transporter [Eubacteriales bacterium]